MRSDAHVKAGEPTNVGCHLDEKEPQEMAVSRMANRGNLNREA